MNINATLIGQLITFVVFVWFTQKYVWLPIIAALEERKKKIAEGLAAADRGVHEQELAQKRALDSMKEAKAQAAEIVGNAKKRADEIVDEAKDQARSEGERIVEAARSELDLEANRVREELRSRVAELAVVGAGRILKREVDLAAHKDIVDALAAEI
ncbi:MAG: F0F1 ATP synthase subunit B [gamma proteobacterium symbiont of Bathyaustriella thionipta]|nr:F0F1 ATP synthase subunit B [gamma proteobacterium symbiont of Bathyaustriella thionipta]